jgi:hypothetical protein
LELFNHGPSKDQAHQIDELFMEGSVASGFATGLVDDVAI